ncbi:hypothetical protein C8A03DRAFT_13830 [Achaetomium macrosporum]|uniref:Uncharacterized protein n=1 Tax=Achaetomium macrosporum TaxID=79813 RepID=A0AAN7HCJ6_9PEZI|nr:hypothetical protein C8A03DRAFT_13830 [Achaetomium macrosporum]
MATSIPLPVKNQIPITPPPDFHMFMKEPPPHFPNPFANGIRQSQPAANVTSHQNPLQPLHQPQRRQPSQQPSQASADLDPSDPTTASTKPQLHDDPTTAAAAAAAATGQFDPRYVAMASRIATYYQQRCQAVANFQQQRCQAWANAQRQKCQEMMQAATVIVAWYIRDRIQRRRKRRRRAFKRGLKARTTSAAAAASMSREPGGGGGGARVTKGEAVRRWVMGVPSAASPAGSTGSRDVPLDKEEADFDMDREVPADKDTQLFNVADNLIKSHLARIDVPLLGVLSFDESETESESESEVDDFMDYEDDGGEEEDGEEYDEERSEAEDYDDDIVGGEGKEEELASTSQNAQPGTIAKRSRKRSRSSVS